MASPAIAETREAAEFSVPAGLPDECMRVGAAFARELEPGLEISFRDSQSGSLSVSRIEGDRVKCIVRASPVLAEALRRPPGVMQSEPDGRRCRSTAYYTVGSLANDERDYYEFKAGKLATDDNRNLIGLRIGALGNVEIFRDDTSCVGEERCFRIKN